MLADLISVKLHMDDNVNAATTSKSGETSTTDQRDDEVKNKQKKSGKHLNFTVENQSSSEDEEELYKQGVELLEKTTKRLEALAQTPIKLPEDLSRKASISASEETVIDIDSDHTSLPQSQSHIDLLSKTSTSQVIEQESSDLDFLAEFRKAQPQGRRKSIQERELDLFYDFCRKRRRSSLLASGLNIPSTSRPTCNASKEESSDFDVAEFLEKEPQGRRKSLQERDLDLFYEYCRNRRRSSLGTSGLVETRKWEEIMERFRSYKAPSTIVPVTVRPSRRNRRHTAQSVTIVRDISSADKSVSTFCLVCNRYVQSLVSYEQGFFTYIAFLCCIIFPFLILCAWMPFLFKGFMDAKHVCPKCGTTLGFFRRF